METEINKKIDKQFDACVCMEISYFFASKEVSVPVFFWTERDGVWKKEKEERRISERN